MIGFFSTGLLGAEFQNLEVWWKKRPLLRMCHVRQPRDLANCRKSKIEGMGGRSRRRVQTKCKKLSDLSVESVGKSDSTRLLPLSASVACGLETTALKSPVRPPPVVESIRRRQCKCPARTDCWDTTKWKLQMAVGCGEDRGHEMVSSVRCKHDDSRNSRMY